MIDQILTLYFFLNPSSYLFYVTPYQISKQRILNLNSKSVISNLPCKKYDMDPHSHSMSFLGTTPLVGGFVEIHTKFHDYSMSFTQVLFVFHVIGTWHGFWTSSSPGISEAFAKKMMGFPSDLVSFSNQTKLPSKRHEKIHECHIFYRDSTVTHE